MNTESKSAGQISSEGKQIYGMQAIDLNFWYGDFQALRSVTTDIKQNLITALIGPSGCGKTTFLRCFNRMNERIHGTRVTGTLKIFGKNIYDPDVSLTELRKAVGMVFQRPNPLPLSIYENVAFGLRIHSEKSLPRKVLDQFVQEALEEVLLWETVKDKLHRKATELPLEAQQKLCIARLLPLKPRVLLLDEPCSALDEEGIEAIEELLLKLKERYTILIVTHNMAQARRIGDECLFMLNGELVEQGPTAEIFLNPKDSRTQDYVEGRYG